MPLIEDLGLECCPVRCMLTLHAISPKKASQHQASSSLQDTCRK